MTNLKVGDRIRLSTGVMATVKEVFSGSTNSNGVSVKTDDTGAVYVLAEIEALGITWELIKPELVEPPVGSVISFVPANGILAAVAHRSSSGSWYIAGGDESWTWVDLVADYGITEYELLRPVQEVVKEVLLAVKAADRLDWASSIAVAKVADQYGVEL